GYEDTSELALSASSDAVVPTVKTSPGRATGSGRSSSASAKLKMAQLAPMPMASERTEMMVKPGLLARIRTPYLTSCHSRSTERRPQRGFINPTSVSSVWLYPESHGLSRDYRPLGSTHRARLIRRLVL